MLERPREVPPQEERLQELLNQGYRVTRIFKPDTPDLEAYIADLEKKGVDHSIIDTGEGVYDFRTGNIKPREIKVLEK